MFFAVILVESHKLLTIPASWSYKLDFVRNFKSGLRQWRDKVIFYSPDILADPNFRLEIQTEFDPDKPACYMANILGSYYTAEDSDAYLARRRTYLPPVYADGRISPTDSEPEFVVQVNDPLLRIKKENEDIVNRIQNEFVDLTANDSIENRAELNSQHTTEDDLSGIDCVADENDDDYDYVTNINSPQGNPENIRDTVEDVSVAQSAFVAQSASDSNENESDGNGNDFDRNKGADANEIELAENGASNDDFDRIEQGREEREIPADEIDIESHEPDEPDTESADSTDEEGGFSLDCSMPMPIKMKAEDELSATITYHLRVLRDKKKFRYELIY